MDLTSKELKQIPEDWSEAKRRKYIYYATTTMDRLKARGVQAFRKEALAYAMYRVSHAK